MEMPTEREIKDLSDLTDAIIRLTNESDHTAIVLNALCSTYMSVAVQNSIKACDAIWVLVDALSRSVGLSTEQALLHLAKHPRDQECANYLVPKGMKPK